MTDSNLLEAYAKSGADEAFAEIVRRNIAAVYSAALRRVGGDGSLAKDVTQAAFIALARKAAVAAGHPFPLAWLYTAVRNEAAHAVRSERRRRIREQQAATLMSNDAETSAPPDWDQVAAVLDASIDELGEEDRRAVLLRFMDQRTFSEMADQLGVAEDAARMRVSRALDRLRTFLRRRGISSSSAALAAVLTENAVGSAPPGLAAAIVSGASASAWVSAGGLGATLTALLLSPLAAMVAVAVVAAGAAIYEGRQAATAEAQLSARRLELKVAKDEFAANQRRLSAANQGRRSPNASARSGTAGNNISPADPKAAGLAFMGRHPEVQQAFEKWEDARTQGMYGAWFRQRQMTPDQIRQFVELKRAGSIAVNLSDLGTVFLTNQTSYGDADLQAQLQGLLGPDGYQSYLAFASSVPGRQLAEGFASMLSETDTPLSSAQAQQMAGIFASAGSPNQPSFDWGSVTAQAQGVLSGPQLAQLENLRQLRQSWQQAVVRH